MSEPTIHKAFFEHNFTCLYHLSAEDQQLSFQAKGLLWYMLSRPSNWVIHRKQLATVYKGERKDNGIDAINRMCDELIARGYLIYTKQDPITGKIIHRYDVYPVPYETFKVMFPQRDIPSMDIPTTVNSTHITRKDSLPSTEENNNKEKENVVVSSDLNDLGMSEDQKLEVSKKCGNDPLKARKLVKRVKAWNGRESDYKACNTILKQWDTWSDELTSKEKEEIKQSEEEDQQRIVEERRALAMKIKEENPNAPFTVKSDSVEVEIIKNKVTRYGHISFREEGFEKRMEKLAKKQGN